jgi:hypothetical protein
LKQFILISIILLSIQVINAQTDEKRALQCDSIIFKDGTANLVLIKEVNRRKIIYILCCYDCAVPRKIKKNEIDTIIYYQEGWFDHQTKYLDNLVKHKEVIPLQVLSTSAKINKNILFVNASPLLLNNTINVNYERILKGNDNVSAFAKIGIGGFINIYGSGGYTMAQLGFLTGKNKHHFELSAGGLLDIPKIGWKDKPLYYPYAVNIGWRVQDPNKNYIFKLGIGLPEFLYFGLGFSF